ncbi:unnamed protein product [Calicophoron daubneyi]
MKMHRYNGSSTDSCCSRSRSNEPEEPGAVVTNRPFSYPPTPCLSPHLPSPAASVLSDDLVATNSNYVPPEKIMRLSSKSSLHSSSSSETIGHVQRQEQSTTGASQKMVSRVIVPDIPNASDQRSVKTVCIPRHRHHVQMTASRKSTSGPSTVIRGADEFDVEVDPYLGDIDHPFNGPLATQLEMNQLQFRGTNSKNQSTDLKANDLFGRNGFRTMFRDSRGTVSNTIRNAQPSGCRDEANCGYITHFPTRQVTGQPFDHPYLSHAVPARRQPNIYSGWSDMQRSYEQSRAQSSRPLRQTPSMLCDRSVTGPGELSSALTSTQNRSRLVGAVDQLVDDGDDSFDPLTQCGCVELGDFKCRNSLLCTVHTMDEKRRVPRQRDLRHLMREARQRQQLNRHATGAVGRRTLPNSCTVAEVSQPVIDLTEDSDLLCCSADGVSDIGNRSCQMRLLSNQPLPNSQVTYRSASDISALHGTGNNVRKQKVLSATVLGPQTIGLASLSNRFVRRIGAREGSATLCSDVAFIDGFSPVGGPFHSIGSQTGFDSSNLDHSYAFELDTSPSDGAAIENRAMLSDDQISSRLITVPAGQTSCTPSGITLARFRRQQQLRRVQNSSVQSVRQWATQLNSSPGDIQLPSCSNVLNDPRVGATDDEDNEVSQANHRELLSKSPQLIDNRNSFPDPTFHGQIISVSAPMVISPSLSQLSYTNCSLPEPQTAQPVSVINQPIMVGRFARSIYGGTQVVREPQGRVIVDDMREKSITGRSRKTARSTLRHAAPVFPSPTFSGLLSSRYQQCTFQPQPNTSVINSARRQPSVSVLGSRPTIVQRPLINVNSEIFPGVIPPVSALSMNESIGVVGCPAISGHATQTPPLLTTNNSYAAPDLSGSSPYSMNVGETTMESDSIDLDYCIQASGTSFVPSTSQIQQCSRPQMQSAPDSNPHSASSFSFVNQDPYPPTGSRFARAIPNPQLQGESGQILCRNRYFVIRPSSLKRSPSLVVRAKRPDTFSTFPTAGDSSSTSAPPIVTPAPQRPTRESTQ